MNAIVADLGILRASWRTAHGGWRIALRNAWALISHRRVLVKTTAGGQLVFCTRLRLIGDTQTDVLRSWFETTPSKDVAVATQAHFRAVDATMDGWVVALAMERLLLLATRILGAIIGVIGVLVQLIFTPSAQLLWALLENPALWTAFALPSLGWLARIILRWRLRVVLVHA